ncbi:competence/damage-inducible protein A [Maritalea porphyrae]|uniref:Molybdenum cofactor biosynthesis protein n=1 Tax=Maritalea porphyrae TaxID=880732 RepID=A0ABQ5UU03_9HYPH|nr:molybdopterin-binding protein [Maritalea porphyrae]GLQ18761.1 molybdenum cofactor biosynthesis protein [Maritalea porphyrae]
MADANNQKRVTAGMLVIGDEILSGRTKDKNIGTVADFCADLNIELCEVRVIADEIDEIVDALNALRKKFTYVFTTGGIGPTHDDITADGVAKAFGVALKVDDRAIKMMQDRFTDYPMNEGRLRMARIPDGGELIPNTVSGAPGIHIGNVYVMAGVPKIMQGMLEAIAPKLETGIEVFSASCDSQVGESSLSEPLAALQNSYPTVKIGSYPQMGSDKYVTQIVLRSADKPLLDEATQKVRDIIAAATKNKLKI